MKLKILGDRPSYRRLLRKIRKSKILGPILLSHKERLLVFDLRDDEDGQIMQTVVKEFIDSQNIEYEQF